MWFVALAHVLFNDLPSPRDGLLMLKKIFRAIN